ncbi:MAG: hypothetical protein AAB152_11450 [Candidatus Coatesbacteria bacterium]
MTDPSGRAVYLLRPRARLLTLPAFVRRFITFGVLLATALPASGGNISTVAGTGMWGYSGDGLQATSAQLYYPWDVALDSAGNLFIADTRNYRIRRVDHATGVISTVAGITGGGYNGDGIPATSARLQWPNGVALDSAGNLYISDTWNHLIRRVDAGSGLITTVAGSMTATGGYNGDGILATSARLNTPGGITVDGTGNLFIADTYNHLVRRVDAVSGLITTVAGSTTATGGYNGDGIPATASRLYWPEDVAFDAGGNLYIGDWGNSRVRRVDAATGRISTVAGRGFWGYDGDGIPATSAELNGVGSVVVARDGILYIGDFFNDRVRRVDPITGLIDTVAGTGTAGYNGDGIPASTASCDHPSGLAVDANGNLFIADSWNHRVRRVEGYIRVPPALGRMLLAPNVLETSGPVGIVRIGLRGHPSESVLVRVYSEAGELVRSFSCSLNSVGDALVPFDGLDDRGVRLGLGGYWLVASGGGVNDRQSLLVVRKRKR